jgi:SAM-dependent methyltransferase
MTTFHISQRSTQSELMDSTETDFETFRACLVDLAKINRLTLAHRPTLQFFEQLAKAGRLPRNRVITIVDVGSGYGDMLRAVDHWAAKRGIRVDLVGVDQNPWSARSAEQATASGRPIRFVTADIFDYRPPARIDIVISSLLTHHLDDATLIRFIAWMEHSAAIGWFVNDLHRHPIPFHVFRLATRALRFHHFVQHDGPVSIARAFSAREWAHFLKGAGVPCGAASVRWHFPFRLCVSRMAA